jgi:hypothetical protein
MRTKAAADIYIQCQMIFSVQYYHYQGKRCIQCFDTILLLAQYNRHDASLLVSRNGVELCQQLQLNRRNMKQNGVHF